MNQLIRKVYSDGFDSLPKAEREAVLRWPGFDMGRYIEYERHHPELKELREADGSTNS